MFPRPTLLRPPALQPGDEVAILSPRWAGLGVFPHVQDLGLQRLREHLQLEQVEYPTTRNVGATPGADGDGGARPAPAVRRGCGGDAEGLGPHCGPAGCRANPFFQDQRAAMLRALDEYNPGVPTVFGLDFGHTDPQVLIPYGGSMTVDGINGTVAVTY
jgi:muramoyltetrapeptide carboxypeptidase LdcA involved in peptidoglycan recycling